MLFIQTEDVLATKKIKNLKVERVCAGQICVLSWVSLNVVLLPLFIAVQILLIEIESFLGRNHLPCQILPRLILIHLYLGRSYSNWDFESAPNRRPKSFMDHDLPRTPYPNRFRPLNFYHILMF